MRRLRAWLPLGGAVAGLSLFATPAHADPITAAIFGATFAATTAGAVVSAVITFAITSAVTFVGNALFGPKAPASTLQERQADVLNLSIGEVSREALFGRVATGGSLVDCTYYGGQYGTDWNLFCIALADHPCESIEGFYVNETYVPWHGGGEVPGYGGQLHVHAHLGADDGYRWPHGVGADSWEDLLPCLGQGALKGMTVVAYAYKADAPDAQTPVWSGRPSFLWDVKGARVYDPRFDGSIPGVTGPQRWADPSTWTWSENASLCEYAYQRGVYALNRVDQPEQLLVGRGLSAVEAPPERIIVAANLCAEPVDGVDGEEIRYAVGAVVRASDSFESVAQMFAEAMAGVISQPEGAVFVEPGQAKSPVATITDADLLIGQAASFQPFRSDSDRVNTVIARYVEPRQKWAETSAPVSRDLDDLAADGGPRELTLSLAFVHSVTRAQRAADIRRRKARLEATAGVMLGPRFAHLEAGDWIGWESARRFGGATRYFRITASGLDQAWRNTLALEEIDFDVFGFGGAGADPTGPDDVEPIDALRLLSVSFEAIQIEGEAEAEDAGPLIPAVRAHWHTPVDPAISTVRIEVRQRVESEDEATAISPTSTTNVNAGELIATNGVGARQQLQARLVPLGPPGRAIVPSAWTNLTTSDLVAGDTRNVGTYTTYQINQALDDLTPVTQTSQQIADFVKAVAPYQASLEDAVRQASARARDAAWNTIRDTVKSVEAQLRGLEDAYLEGHKPGQFLRALGRFTPDNKSLILNVENVYGEAGKTLAQSFTSIRSEMGDNRAAYDHFVETSATNDQATASALTALSAQTGQIKASYELFVITQTDDNSALAAATQTLASNFSSFSGNVTTNYATKSYADGAVSTLSTSVEAKIKTDGTGTPGFIGAKVYTESLALATASGQLYGSYGFTVTAGNAIVGMRAYAASGATDYGGIVFYAPSLRIQAGLGSTGSLIPFTYDSASGTLFLENISLRRGNIRGFELTTTVGYSTIGTTTLTTTAAVLGAAQEVNCGSGHADIVLTAFCYVENDDTANGQDVTVMIYKNGSFYRQKLLHVGLNNQASITWPEIDLNVTGYNAYSLYAKSTPGTGGHARCTQCGLVLQLMFRTGA